ncbi:isoleucine--tRNA ligase [Candidatus Paracaedibacter symbiosus]|uniref:isoleucine--tRNA ligase n=1 Tax=Candidatus Paracaedibacter symbiosus TaxID=244582 RepID=UPI000509DF7D|nr:isoleucine--tRNA ligase [Candidatus Paracaedibacter symbiosus]
MDYKNTVFLPKTDFPMKAGLAKREPELLAHWDKINLYPKLREKSKQHKKFILHFGPPYANGHIHIGHALSETLKDVINKVYQMKGYDAPMVPGWDCHGLPIEWKVEEGYRASGLNKDDVHILEFREECRNFARKWIDIQRKEFMRLGIVADWDNYYSTMNFETEAKIVEQLGHFLLNGSLYRGLRPVMWSVVEKTALADAEVEYKDHTSDSIYVAFPVKSTSHTSLEGVSMVIWTTTPWTLPGNRAIAYNGEFTYVVVKNNETGKSYVVAKDLLENIIKDLSLTDYSIVTELPGTELKGTICHHPMAAQGYTFDVPLLPGEHVTADAGTGLVHTAPGHGLEDFAVGREFGLEVPETVADDGHYYDHVPYFAGIHIFKAAPKVMEVLKENGNLLAAAKLIHSYPHSWRSKAPLIYRTTAQWFISMEKTSLRKKALEAIEEVKWFPAQGKNRIKSMVETRPDWCVSRQRAWGTPITLFVNKKTGEVLRDAGVHARIVDAIRQEGGDVWFSEDNSHFLGPDFNPNDYEKVTDILDVWFDSGCSHEFVLGGREDQQWPADLYLEGSDQHRGWFQASLLESCGVHGKAPYKQVLTHGFVLDEKGYKMSKSQVNGVAPETLIETLGADILRLWIVSANYAEDMRIGPEILKQQEDTYRRFRNTLRYLLGALDGYSNKEMIGYEGMPPLEKWVLNRLAELNQQLHQAAEDFDFMSFYTQLHTFCAMDLSAFYFDIRKDCLYCDDELSHKRRATRTVMHHIFECLTHWLAPVLSFTAEEAWSMRHQLENDSIHLQQFPSIPTEWLNPEIVQYWETIRKVRSVVTGAIEIERAAKTIGSSLQASVAIYLPSDLAKELQGVDLAEVTITSTAHLVIAQPPAAAFTVEDGLDIGVIVNAAEGMKCQRCWKVLPEVQDSEYHVCNRCEEVVAA